jgi:hypothetical protein
MAKQETFVDIDFNQNQTISRVIENRSSAPLTAVAGQEYYDTTTNIAYFYNGTAWIPFYDANQNSAISPVQAYNIDRYYTFGVNTTTIYVSGLATGVTMGTPASVFFSGATATKIQRCRFNSGVSSNSTCGYRGANASGNPTDFAVGTGFYAIFNFTFGLETLFNANSFLFAGLSGTLSDTLIGATAVQSLTNIIGVGSAPADSFMSIFHNDGSGTATKIPLNPAFFPSNRTAGATNTKFFCLELFNPFGNTSLITWRITAIDGITQIGQESGVITTNIPASTTLLSFWCGRTTGSTASSVEMSISSLQGWTQY